MLVGSGTREWPRQTTRHTAEGSTPASIISDTATGGGARRNGADRCLAKP